MENASSNEEPVVCAEGYMVGSAMKAGVVHSPVVSVKFSRVVEGGMVVVGGQVVCAGCAVLLLMIAFFLL